jgi:isopropylmalate/homocitrate/citramalate synthase
MSILICDVGPRDGLQMESITLPVARRIQLCTDLADAGLRRIEAVSFVSPTRVPTMAGSEDVFRGLPVRDTTFAALVLNQKGFDRAIAAGVRQIHYALPVTDAYADRNQGTTVAKGVALARSLAEQSRATGVRFVATLSAAFGCPFEGRIGASTIETIAEQMLTGGPSELCLADSIGVGVPTQVTDLVRRLLALGAPVVGCHFHNTRNTGLANVVAAIDAGATVLDASIGGVGGCPFAPKATGNIATEDLVYLLEEMGIDTGVDLDLLISIARRLGDDLGHEMPGMVSRAGGFPTPLAH